LYLSEEFSLGFIGHPNPNFGKVYNHDTIRDTSRCYPEAEKLDSTRAGGVFLSGAVAMMVNWFGFAARCERPEAPLRGKVAIAPIPSDEGKPPASLSVFWTLGIGSGSKHKQAAYDFLHFLMQPDLDFGIVNTARSVYAFLPGEALKYSSRFPFTAELKRFPWERGGSRAARTYPPSLRY
jgi:ABC-type glycerol-3-phosphate transport system substrate-binding protein